MISFAMGGGGGGVGVGRKVVEFCGSIVCALWHDVLLFSYQLDAVMGECGLPAHPSTVLNLIRCQHSSHD